MRLSEFWGVKYPGFVLEFDEETQTVKSIQWADMSGAHEPIVFVKG